MSKPSLIAVQGSYDMVRGVKVIAVCCLVLLPAASLAAEAEPEIRLVGGDQAKTVEVVGLSKKYLADFAMLSEDDQGWTNVLAIYVVDKTTATQAIAGRYTIDETTLHFTPRYALRPG